MKPTSLFPDDPDAKPIPHPGPPLVCLRRLMLVRERRAGAEVIQDIPFRLGLNIIDTPESPSDEVRTVGHNVGKTLLVRLIRYCFGDRNFVNKSVRLHFQNRFPDAYVLAEVIVAGTCWAIARPFNRGKPSWGISGGTCEALLGDASSFASYDDFARAVDEATIARLPNLTLPYIERAPLWTDILGWLARDQHCRFRHHNEWRESDMDAGPPSLKLEDANLITRAVMGVLDAEEQKLSDRLDKLRAKRKQAGEKCDGLAERIKYTRAHLMRRVGLGSEAPLGKLFAGSVRQSLEKLEEDLQGEQSRVVEKADLERFEAKRLQAERELGVAEGRAEQMKATRDLVATQLAQAEAGQRSSFVASLAQQLGCEHPECPLKNSDRPPGSVDPIILARAAEYREELRQLDAECERQARAVSDFQKAKRDATEQLQRRRKEYEIAIKDIQLKRGEYRLLGEQVRDYEKDIGEHEKEVAESERLDASIEKAQEERGHLMDRHARRFKKLNGCFDKVLHELLPDANGSLVLDNKVGLSPKTDEATGEAVGTAGKVVGFDLACLLAGISGLGNHPRLLIHDSPREADLERTAYYRLFQWAAKLEQAFSGEPPFQYILTTTTPPPKALARRPYVCLTLDAREESGLLLKERF